MDLPMVLGEGTWTQTQTVTFMLMDALSKYNVIMGRPSLSWYAAIISPTHLMMKFPIEDEKERIIEVKVVHGDHQVSIRCYVVAVRISETHKRYEKIEL